MIAGCDTDNALESVATTVVSWDLFIAFFLWLALVAGRPFTNAANEDVNGEIVMATDFTVVLEVPHYKDEMKDLRPVYWAWA